MGVVLAPLGAWPSVLALAASILVTVSGLLAWNTVTWAGGTLLYPWVRTVLLVAAALMLVALALTPISSGDKAERAVSVAAPLALCASFVVAGRWNRVVVDRLIRRIQADVHQPKADEPMRTE